MPRVLLRLLIALAGGVVVVVALVGLLSFLVSGQPQDNTDQSLSVVLETWFRGRPAPAREDFVRVQHGAIVPASRAADLLRQCSRSSVDDVEAYWRPTPGMIADLENRLPAFLEDFAGLEPLGEYARQYAGVVSAGRRVIYASFQSRVSPAYMTREIVILCDGGNSAWGVVFDLETKAFSDLRVNGSP